MTPIAMFAHVKNMTLVVMAAIATAIAASMVFLGIIDQQTVEVDPDRFLFSDQSVRLVVDATAAEAISRELRWSGAVPSEFTAIAGSSEDAKVVVDLSHKDDELPENLGLEGNPSGQSRTCTFDRVTEDVKCLWWQ